jgi:hypothetical protein
MGAGGECSRHGGCLRWWDRKAGQGHRPNCATTGTPAHDDDDTATTCRRRHVDRPDSRHCGRWVAGPQGRGSAAGTGTRRFRPGPTVRRGGAPHSGNDWHAVRGGGGGGAAGGGFDVLGMEGTHCLCGRDKIQSPIEEEKTGRGGHRGIGSARSGGGRRRQDPSAGGTNGGNERGRG